jgi:HSP20 family protein
LWRSCGINFLLDQHIHLIFVI